MQKFHLTKSSSTVVNDLKVLKKRGLIKEIQKLSVKKARNEFYKIRSYFSYKKKIDVLIKKNFEIENIPVRYYRGKNKSKYNPQGDSGCLKYKLLWKSYPTASGVIQPPK